MKKILLGLILIILIIASGGIGYFIGNFSEDNKIIIPVIEKVQKPLLKYTIENLSKTNIKPGEFEIVKEINEEEDFTSYLFKFTFDPTLQVIDSESPKTRGLPFKDQKTTTGQINFPNTGFQISEGSEPSVQKPLPVILMLRGYVDQELYQTGDGTRNAAEYFAKNGFITIAPDFLGYGESDEEAGNIFETRFQTYTTVLSLIESLDQIETWDRKNIFFWAHSNGGQIALTVLEITGAKYPTTLWAPVSKPFPYSILYYTDESEDQGKLIRRELAKFEDLYDTDKYSLTEYFGQIQAPIQIHQGSADNAVPIEWSNELYKILLNLDLDLDYYQYPGADHNLRPNWDTVIQRDLEFFNSYLRLQNEE